MAHAVTCVPQVTSAIQGNQVASAGHVSAMATLTPKTQSLVTPELASVSIACTTLLVHLVISANMDTMATHWSMIADDVLV